MPLHVPYRATAEIERSAGRLLAEYAAQRGVRLAPPIPVDDIVEKHLKLTLEFDDLHALFDIERPAPGAGPDILGALYVAERRVVIDERLDPESDSTMEGRYRFTLGHEAGHWCEHRWLFLPERAGALFGTAEQSTIVCRSQHAKDRIELQADLFAANLLMPRQLVEQAWCEEFADGKPRLVMADAPPSEQYVVPARWESTAFGIDLSESDADVIYRIARPLAERFGVSVQAMRIRLEQIGLLLRQPPVQEMLPW